MTSDTPEVKRLLVALADKIGKSTGQLSDQGFGNSLNGLQGMSSFSPEVIQLLRVLNVKLKDSQLQNPAQGIYVCQALMGMKSLGLNCNAVEVKDLIQILVTRVEKIADNLNPVSISSLLNGLSALSDDDALVRTLLTAIADVLTQSSIHDLEPGCFANGVYGLKRIRGIYPESRKLINAVSNMIAPQAKSSKFAFTGIEIARTLYGLQCVNYEDCIEARPIF